MPPEPRLLLVGAPDQTAVAVPGWRAQRVPALPEALEDYDAAVLFTEPGEAPWGQAYRLYLAGVPMRIGRSAEFGGSLLSRCLPADASDAMLLDELKDGTA